MRGNPLWVAERSGFRDPDRASSPNRPLHAHKSFPLMRAGAGLIVAELESLHDMGLCVLDINASSVRPLNASKPIRTPFALPDLPGHGRCLVAPGFSRRVSYNVWEWTLVAVRLDGTVVWELTMDAPPQGAIADAAGTVVTWSTPTQERWSKYRQWFDLSSECVVRAVSASGEHLWTWHPPGPLTANPVFGASGQLYVAADDRLWALG